MDEAKAIKTAYLRAQMLPSPAKEKATEELRSYLDARVTLYRGDATGQEIRGATRTSKQMQEALWSEAIAGFRQEPPPGYLLLYAQSLNEVVESQEARTASTFTGVPEIQFLLVFFTTIIAMGLLGYGCGTTGRREFVATTLLTLLISLALFVTVDLDHPQDGLLRAGSRSLDILHRDLFR